jgi:hypothetical protein
MTGGGSTANCADESFEAWSIPLDVAVSALSVLHSDRPTRVIRPR